MGQFGKATFWTLLILSVTGVFQTSAFAQIPNIPLLTPIEEDDAAPEIAKAKQLYARLTAANWSPVSVVNAKVSNGNAKQYPNGDDICKTANGATEVNFVLSGKSDTPRIVYGRMESVDCTNLKSGGALALGVFTLNDRSMVVGAVRFTNKSFQLDSGIHQLGDQSAFVYRQNAQRVTELAATASADGTTVVALEPGYLFGHKLLYSPSNNDYYSYPLPLIQARLILPGVGYFDGKASKASMFDFGAIEHGVRVLSDSDYLATLSWGFAYTQFVSDDESFRITGPMMINKFDGNKPAIDSYHEVYEENNNRRRVIKYFVLKDKFDSAKQAMNYLTPTEVTFEILFNNLKLCSAHDCDSYLIETRKNSRLGGPGAYTFIGVIDFSKAPDLDKMVEGSKGKWFLTPSSYADHAKAGLFPHGQISNERLSEMQAKLDRRTIERFRQRDHRWDEKDQSLLKALASLDAKFAQDAAEAAQQRRADQARNAATASAIMGAIADVGVSAQNAVGEMNRSQQMVNRANAAASGGAAAGNIPYVAPPLTAEQRQLLASWGRKGRTPSSSASTSRNANSTPSSSNAVEANASPTRKPITQEEAMQLMTSAEFTSEDGTVVVTNGASTDVRRISEKRYPNWDLLTVPVKDMVVTGFKSYVNDDTFRLTGTGLCSTLQWSDAYKPGEVDRVRNVHSAPCAWVFGYDDLKSGMPQVYYFSAAMYRGTRPL